MLRGMQLNRELQLMRRRATHLTYPSRDPDLPRIGGTIASVPICRVQLVRERCVVIPPTIRSVEDAAEAIGEYLATEDREHFVILMLDAQNSLLGVHTVSIGTLTAAIVSPREVFKAAILANAASIILGHNHLSSDPTPSPEDRLLTETLQKAGKLLDIQVLDHLIVAKSGAYASLKRLGVFLGAQLST